MIMITMLPVLVLSFIFDVISCYIMLSSYLHWNQIPLYLICCSKHDKRHLRFKSFGENLGDEEHANTISNISLQH